MENKPTSQTRSAVGQAVDTAKEMMQDVRSKDAGEITSDLKDKAAEVSLQVQDKAAELTSQAADKTDDAMTAAGQNLQTLAQTVRDNAPSGMGGDLATSAASTLEKSGTYLQQSDPAAVRSDLEAMIRRNPIPSLLVGLGIGFLLARALGR